MDNAPLPPPQPIEPVPPTTPEEVPPQPPKKKRLRNRILIAFAIIFSVLIAAAIATFLWFTAQLQPVQADTTQRQIVVIEAGTTPTQIAETLKENGLIRSVAVFQWYTRFDGSQNSLQAGSYRLSAGESLPQIVERLTRGEVDTFDITFLPGATLADHRDVLLKAGYSEEEVDAGLAADYSDVALLQNKPASADLEGYIFGETYRVNSGATVETILRQTFTEFQRVIDEFGLVEGFATQDLTVHQAIILGSIIQREAFGGEEPRIAQVFLLRLSEGMPLGADPTYQYIADKLGVPRDTNLDNPYNTRIYPGLPPGPIASPGEAALRAIVNPAEGDYVFFLHGDDNQLYLGRTIEEHERNIVDHCQQKCQLI